MLLLLLVSIVLLLWLSYTANETHAFLFLSRVPMQRGLLHHDNNNSKNKQQQLYVANMMSASLHSSQASVNSNHDDKEEHIKSVKPRRGPRTPWNTGKSLSSELKEKIRNSVMAYALKQREIKASALGFTMEEYEDFKKQQKRERCRKNKQNLARSKKELRENQANRMKEVWQDPVYREKHNKVLANARVLMQLPSVKAKISDSLKTYYTSHNVTRAKRVISPETKKKLSESMKLQWKIPEYKNNILSKREAPGWKAMVSNIIKLKWQDPVYREKMKSSTIGKRKTTNLTTIAIPKTNSTIPKNQTRIRKVASTTNSSTSIPRPKRSPKTAVPKNVTISAIKIPAKLKNGSGLTKTNKLASISKAADVDIEIDLSNEDLHLKSDEVMPIVVTRQRRVTPPVLSESVPAIKLYKDGKLVGMCTKEEYESLQGKSSLDQ